MAVSNLEIYFLQLVNQSRAEAGLAPLVYDAELDAAAENHTVWMDQTDIFDHTGEGGSSPGGRITAAGYDWMGWAENIAQRPLSGPNAALDQATVDQLHLQLMNSPGHRANILDPTMTEIGIGLHQGFFNWPGMGLLPTAFVTEVFGNPTAAEAAEADKGLQLFG
jgi:uncharacterized protein YkwD